MIKRAIVLVPGYSRRAHLAARDQLAAAIDHYTDGYIINVSDGDESEGFNYKTIKAGNREDGDEIELDVYEAFWGDLVPDWSEESPWARFKRATKLIVYWSFGGIAKSIARRETPTRTIWAMMIAALCLFVWYLVTAKVLILAIGDPASGLPPALEKYMPPALEITAREHPEVVDQPLVPETGDQSVTETETAPEPETAPSSASAPTPVPAPLVGFDRVIAHVVAVFVAVVTWVNALPLILFFVGLVGLSRLESISNVASFTRAYLRDDPMGEDDIGLRAKSRRRVLDVLDYVHMRDTKDDAGKGTGVPLYDDVHVVAHSLGSAIAVDALAEYGAPLAKTVLHTWGGAFGVLVQQEPLIEMEIGKLHSSETLLQNWIDVVIRKDIFASDRKTPFVYKNGIRSTKRYAPVFPATLNPPMPMKQLFGYTDLHKAYYRSETAMLMLVKPASALPPLIVPALPKGSLTNG